MRLIKIDQFRKRFFVEGSLPSMASVRKWIEDEQISGGRRVGTQYYIDLDVWETDEDSLVAGVLAGQD